ncbi:hypothetical protein NUM3379_41100 [Kineococcus sp. NUM-3379]
MARTAAATSSKRAQLVLAAVVFLVVATVLTFVFGSLFKSYALGVGPALIMAGAISAPSLVKLLRNRP